jgi:poly-beta-1,6-N-acetyl-D-glucosamine synthase
MVELGWAVRALGLFALAYPITMSFVWTVGGLYYFVRREFRQAPIEQPPSFTTYPLATALVPCHNEGVTVRETLQALLEQRYPNLEIIAIDDGSTDDTGALLDDIAAEHPRIRVVHLATNQGKAVALKMGALASHGEYLICIDGDALLDEYAAEWLIHHLVSGARVGAVTGNPRIRNRSSVLGKLQVGEFSSIIGMIKRAQRTYGRLFTVSGVVTAYRRTALHRIGYWSDTIITEDIDISWRLQMDHWDIRYEPRALCSILMPDTVRGLWNQRLRWAKGGVQVIRAHSGALRTWRRRRMWPLLVESLVTLVWAYTVAVLTVLLGVGAAAPLPSWMRVGVLRPSWATVLLATVCMTQFTISLLIDRQYEPEVIHSLYWMIWYPVIFWMLGMATIVTAVPLTLFSRRDKRAIWTSPARSTG